MSGTWGMRGRWKSFDGSAHGFQTQGHATREEASEAWHRIASEMGWTPAKWWQFWRWGENK